MLSKVMYNDAEVNEEILINLNSYHSLLECSYI